MFRQIIGVLGVAALASLPPALAQTYVPSGSTTPTGLSGMPGSEDITKSIGNAFMYSLTGYEKADKPCRLSVKGWNSQVVTYAGCSNGNYPKIAALAHNENVAVTGIQVCMNNKDTRVKGVKLFGKKPNSAGEFVSGNYSASWTRTNCKTWKQRRNCPTGKAAVGVKLEATNGSVTGIRLLCSGSTVMGNQNATIATGRLNGASGVTATGYTGHDPIHETEDVITQGMAPVYQIGISERQDRPCYVQLDAWSTTGSPVMKTGGDCTKKSASYRKAAAAVWPMAKDQERGIVAIRACMDQAIRETFAGPREVGNRIKGIEVWSGTADAQGRFIADGASDKFSRPNCYNWTNKVSCPAGQVAVGVRLGKKNLTTPEHVNKIALLCRSFTRN